MGSYEYWKNYLCRSGWDNVHEEGHYGLVPVRPVVILPSDMEIKEGANGVYELAE